MKNDNLRLYLIHLAFSIFLFIISIVFTSMLPEISDFLNKIIVEFPMSIIVKVEDFFLTIIAWVFLLLYQCILVGMIIIAFILFFGFISIMLHKLYPNCNKYLLIIFSITPFAFCFLHLTKLPIPNLIKENMNPLFFLMTFLYALSPIAILINKKLEKKKSIKANNSKNENINYNEVNNYEES